MCLCRNNVDRIILRKMYRVSFVLWNYHSKNIMTEDYCLCVQTFLRDFEIYPRSRELICEFCNPRIRYCDNILYIFIYLYHEFDSNLFYILDHEMSQC